MAVATARFVPYRIVGVRPVGQPPARIYPLTTRKTPILPRVAPPPARMDRREDWSDVEALLASLPSLHETAPRHARRRSTPVLLTSVVGTAAFAGLITTALYASSPADCGSKPERCARQLAAANAPAAQTPAPYMAKREIVARHEIVARREIVVAAQADTGVSQPVVQGRSVSEAAPVSPYDAEAPVAGQPTHRKKHHRHWR